MRQKAEHWSQVRNLAQTVTAYVSYLEHRFHAFLGLVPVPAKILGAVALGITVAMLVLEHPNGGLVAAFTKGVIGTGLALLSFGTDPLKDKNLIALSDRERHAVAQKIVDVHTRFDGIVDAVCTLKNEAALNLTLDLAPAVRRLTQAVMLATKHHRRRAAIWVRCLTGPNKAQSGLWRFDPLRISQRHYSNTSLSQRNWRWNIIARPKIMPSRVPRNCRSKLRFCAA